MLEISLNQNASYLKETRFGQVYPPVEGQELFEASVTPLIKVVTQMKFEKIATLLPKDLLFTLYNMGIYLAPAGNKINGIYILLLVLN